MYVTQKIPNFTYCRCLKNINARYKIFSLLTWAMFTIFSSQERQGNPKGFFYYGQTSVCNLEFFIRGGRLASCLLRIALFLGGGTLPKFQILTRFYKPKVFSVIPTYQYCHPTWTSFDPCFSAISKNLLLLTKPPKFGTKVNPLKNLESSSKKNRRS